jgi:hypothetical protein
MIVVIIKEAKKEKHINEERAIKKEKKEKLINERRVIIKEEKVIKNKLNNLWIVIG